MLCALSTNANTHYASLEFLKLNAILLISNNKIHFIKINCIWEGDFMQKYQISMKNAVCIILIPNTPTNVLNKIDTYNAY